MPRLAPAALLAALLVAACGRVGAPVPPETRLPRPVTDLTAGVRDSTIELAWTNPTQRADGSRLRDLVRARVFRHESAAGAEPRPALLSRGRIAGYTEIATIPLGGPPTGPVAPGGPSPAPGEAAAVIEGNRVTLRDRRGLVGGRRYTYVVSVEDGQGRTSAPSARRTVAFVAAPEPPVNLTAEALENAVRLRWQPPARLADGSPLAGEIRYEVLRAADPGAPLVPITPEPIAATELIDRNLENDHAYAYAVRAVRRDEGTTASGPASARVTATPVDMTPPAPPTGLVAAPAGRSVRLAWTPSPDADVASYVVYRAAAGAAPMRVGSVEAPSTVLVDRDVPAGTWRYTVTAVDRSSRANESAPSNEARVTVP
jgi:hypothetical protein